MTTQTNAAPQLAPYEVDTNRQYILAGDISGSMDQNDPNCGGNTRYKYMLEKFEQFVKASEDFDPDGPTVMLFGENVKTFPNTNLEAVRQNLENVTFEGYTNTDKLIAAAWAMHAQEKTELKAKGETHPGTTLLIFTDGEPTNHKAVERVIVEITQKLETNDEFDIEFITVGTISPDLQKYLHNLDEGLKGAKYDIVEIAKVEEIDFLNAVKSSQTHQAVAS